MLSDSESQYRLLFESHPHPMWVFDIETLSFLAVNDAAVRHYGYSRETFLSMTLRDIRPAEEVPLLLDALSTLKSASGNFGIWRHRKRDGALIEAEITTSEITFCGRAARLVLATDVTERRRAEEALRESENRYRMIIENVHEIVYMIHTSDDPFQGELQFISGQVEKMIGYRPEAFLEDRTLFFRIIHPDDLRGFKELTRTIFSGKKEGTREYRLRHKESGAYRWVEDKVVPQIGPDGRVASIFGVARDVTERKQVEKELQESQERFQLAGRATNDAIWDWDLVTSHVSWSRAVETLFRYPPGEVGSDATWWSDRIHPDDKKRVVSRIQSVIQRAGRSWSSEYRFRRGDGSYAYILDRSYIIHDDEGKPVRMVGAMTDMTARKQAEEALAAEKERLVVTLQSIGDGVITTDTGEKITLMNSVAEALTGWHQEEALGTPLGEVFCPIDGKTGLPAGSLVEAVLRSGEIVKLSDPLRLRKRGGKESLITACAAPVRDKRGAAIGAVLVFGDVTEKQKLEDDLLRTDKLEAVGLLAGGIAHDFNNILTAILGNLSLVKLSIDPGDPIYERLGEAENASLRAKDLAQQLLTFAKGGTPIKKATSIRRLLEKSIPFSLRGSNIDAEFSFSEALWPVEIDEGQISQVIHNLIINAQQAMPEGGTLQVRAENYPVTGKKSDPPLPAGRYIKLSIRDFGIGIPKEHLQKVFDPYFTTKQKGSGLGLPTSYSIVKKHKGYMTAASGPGKGATFSVYLPACLTEIESEKKPEEPVHGKGRVLIMDDEPAVRDVAGEILQLLGYEVAFSEEGGEAIARYREAMAAGRPFDLVIMDLTVPGKMGGKEAIQKLLELDPGVKAVVSSGYSSDPIMAEYADYGFKGVIAKPYQLQELSRTVHEVIAGGPAGDPPGQPFTEDRPRS